jgi:hypothetical protein
MPAKRLGDRRSDRENRSGRASDVAENAPYELDNYGPYGARGRDRDDSDYPGGFDEKRRGSGARPPRSRNRL